MTGILSKRLLQSRQVLRTQQAIEKVIHVLLAYMSTNTRQQNVCRIHTYIWLASEILGETIARKELCNEPAITKPSEPKPFSIPGPGKAHRQDNDLLQRIQLTCKAQPSNSSTKT